jgi:hypothetical protein
MPQFSQLLLSGDFVQGVTSYRDHYPGEEQAVRVVVPITIEGRLVVQAILDTGSPWCILDPEIARQVGVAVEMGYEPERKLLVRGIWYSGKLLRIGISLEAQQGDSVQIDATVFVPILAVEEPWPHPNFIGLDGFLNRIRFAVDPAENTFYFGTVD